MKLTMLSATVAAALALGTGMSRAADADLVVFDWAGYEDPEFTKGYTEKHGEGPTYAFFGDEEEAFQKLRAGFRVDAAHPCSQSVVKWMDADLLAPIDTSKIERWDDLLTDFRDIEAYQKDGEYYFVPMDWGNTLVTYRSDLIDGDKLQSLKAFADPQYQGRVSVGDNVDDAYALAFLATGVTDWTKATDEQLEAASDFLRQVHKNVRSYWTAGSELAQLMASDEVLFAWAWNETATTMNAEGHKAATKRDTDEGASSWVCGYVKMKDAPGSEEKFYDFINAWLEDRTAEYIVSAWGYGHSNAEAMGKIDIETLKGAGFFGLEEFRDKTLWQAPIPSAMREKMIAEFEKIKAGF